MTATEVPPPLDVDPARRIFGLETEFGLHFRHASERKVTSEEVAGALFHSVVQWGRSSNVFLTNGARLYIDVGAHPEYATAECDTLTDLIAQDKAGERIVGDLVADGERRLAGGGDRGGDPPLQEQRGLRRQLVRVSRELPRASPSRLRLVRRLASSVSRDSPDHSSARVAWWARVRRRATASRRAPITCGRRCRPRPHGRAR